MTNRVLPLLSLLLPFATVGVAAPALSQDNAVGRDAYTTSCAVCHGTDGRGHGEFAPYLTIAPSDLTKLSDNNDGVFPFLKVFQTIDGRAVVRGHGMQMPVWGDAFTAQVGESAGPYGAELLVRAKIVALVDHIESLQE